MNLEHIYSFGVSLLTKRAVTNYLEHGPYQRLKDLLRTRFGKPISQELDEFIARRLAELEGTQVQGAQATSDEYEDLKRKHLSLIKDADAIRKRLVKMKVYDKLEELVEKLGLNFEDFSNVDEVAPKLLGEWKDAEEAHEFITLIETVREKRQVERRLAEIRSGT